ncbi:GAF sensor signal transduction histidine kinase [Stigmatella aurantiaca]|uniref:histidine kinase n=1 Tax=Stigmatella aurantiaca TaxID=41 RepID=A0A1H7XJ30_STIAU|nr:GAF domain-containing sensor histidine kinase [Stigmatella aurantiaca]SEM33673.1 GAF sensor signal transduction histidine kinase [Stigmatella aurantiaca]
MKSAPLPRNEEARLENLVSHGILDTPPEQGFDDLVRLASLFCAAPVALVSLIDQGRQWFKARVGTEATETPRDIAFCSHAILQEGLLVVPDARQDERFQDNPLVIGDPHIRFYAGTPLKSQGGHSLGTLCVIDSVPRELKPEQAEALRLLGRQVESQLQLRLHALELARREAESRSQRDALARMQRHKDELLQLVARDLQAPLSTIQTHASLMQVRPQIPDDARGAARDIRETAEGVQRLVGNLLEASREDSPLVPRLAEFDFTALMAEVARDFSMRTHGTHRQFTHGIRVTERLVTADRDLLRRAVENLLDNSFRFTALGSGKVALEATQPAPGLLEVRIRDEGPGIPSNTRPYVFETQLPEGVPSAARARASNSLGLAFSRRVIEAHGGWIWVEDNQPKGTLFCLRIPVRPANTQALAS